MSAPRLSDEQKAEIIAAYVSGEKIKSIAARFGVDQSYPTLLAKRHHAPRRNNTRCVKYRRRSA